MTSSFRLLLFPLILLLAICEQVQARGAAGGPCRVQTIETLLVEPAKAANLSTTHYMATLQINILFASDASDEERAGLELGSSLRIWTSGSGNGNDNRNQTVGTLLSFEHFAQEHNGGDISMIVKTMIPLEVSSIEMTIEKGGIDNYCHAISPVLLDKRRCIDVMSATVVKTSKVQSENVAIGKSEDETFVEVKPEYEEYNVTVFLLPTRTNLDRTNQRLPPTHDIALQLYSGDVTIQNYTFWPEEPTQEKSHRLTFRGTVQVMHYGSLYSDDYLQMSATDRTMDLRRTCGEYFHARIDGSAD